MHDTNRFEILLENDDFIAINKPSGMLTIPDRIGKEESLQSILRQSRERILVVHRIDRDTSGLVMFAKTEQSHRDLCSLFESREIEKYYVGLVHGKPASQEGQIDAAIAEHPSKNGKMVVNSKGKPSATDYEVLESFRQYSWLKFRIHTGRTHQIRVHMNHIGHSIVCDDLYGDPDPIYISSLKRNYKLSKKEETERPILGRLALHSYSVRFNLGGKDYSIEAEVPKDLRATLQQLRKHM